MDVGGKYIVWHNVCCVLSDWISSSVGVESYASFLEKELFEILSPGLEETLKVAKSTEVRTQFKTALLLMYIVFLLQRRKRFNALDYLVEYLYR